MSLKISPFFGGVWLIHLLTNVSIYLNVIVWLAWATPERQSVANLTAINSFLVPKWSKISKIVAIWKYKD